MNICISPSQRAMHVAAETVALFAVAPFMFWLSGQKELEPRARTYAMAIGIGTLLMDGYLLSRYIRRDAQAQAPAAPAGLGRHRRYGARRL